MTNTTVPDHVRGNSFDPEALVGQVIGEKYAIQEMIARGGTSIVYKALDKELGRMVALKVILSPRTIMSQLDEIAIQRFKREGKSLAQIEHPNITPIFEVGIDEGVLPHYYIYYMAMMLMEGETLAERLERLKANNECMAWCEVRRIIRDVAGALDYIHGHEFHFVHRDVTPSNIMLVKDSAYLFDFGLVKALSYPTGATETYADFKTMTIAGMAVGTPAYWSPEQMHKGWIAVDHRADIYALGGVLYSMVTGELPYKEDLIGYSHLSCKEPPRPSNTNAALFPFDSVVARAMAKSPDDRYQSASELAQALETDLDQVPNFTRGREKAAARDIARRIPGCLSVLLAILLVVFIGLQYLDWFQPPMGLPSGWQSSTEGVSMVADGEHDYLVTVGRRNTAYAILMADQMIDNPQVSVEAELESGPQNTVYGLVFQHVDDFNYYAFAITGLGQVGIWQLRDGHWGIPSGLDQDQGWVRQKYIHADSPNRVEITIRADMVCGWINSQPVLIDMELDEIRPGSVGFFVSTPRNGGNREAKVRFSSFMVRK